MGLDSRPVQRTQQQDLIEVRSVQRVDPQLALVRVSHVSLVRWLRQLAGIDQTHVPQVVALHRDTPTVITRHCSRGLLTEHTAGSAATCAPLRQHSGLGLWLEPMITLSTFLRHHNKDGLPMMARGVSLGYQCPLEARCRSRSSSLPRRHKV